ncbi:hypothetical protein KSF78_0003830 [Schistosoma japonicum]|nr:hypothetical protein KSF78_0003830 [Schistosoma japonicum]KAH8867885.1 hypothetical protein KSF78_0003830 [Schistosoma japonicum]KAH8867887.1 hypothetical protein KSF78_0003830 [Schistosoma japonicum]KAH8867888.1 hypothetical protein KSF78_0003830 [Schistosoma japonicum]KAH8867889.1 hypothetical protein KSF78_0003830 [Schistosoma japonicum]
MNNETYFDDIFWLEVFRKVDKNRDKRINRKEFKKYISTYGGTFSHKDLQKLFDYCDEDKSGYIDFNEFKKFMQGH